MSPCCKTSPIMSSNSRNQSSSCCFGHFTDTLQYFEDHMLNWKQAALLRLTLRSLVCRICFFCLKNLLCPTMVSLDFPGFDWFQLYQYLFICWLIKKTAVCATHNIHVHRKTNSITPQPEPVLNGGELRMHLMYIRPIIYQPRAPD